MIETHAMAALGGFLWACSGVAGARALEARTGRRSLPALALCLLFPPSAWLAVTMAWLSPSPAKPVTSPDQTPDGLKRFFAAQGLDENGNVRRKT